MTGTVKKNELFSLGQAPNAFMNGVYRFAERILRLDGLNSVYDDVAHTSAEDFSAATLERVGVDFGASDEDMARIPETGGFIVVANHPYGGLEGLILPALIGRRRKDIKIIANEMLGRMPQMHELSIFVDAFDSEEAKRKNLRAVREALGWVRRGGCLIMFPSGTVSHWHWRDRSVIDPGWTTRLAKIVRHAKVPVIPAYFPGHNGLAFQLAGLMHPRLRTALLPRMALNKRGRRLEMLIGNAVPFARLQAMEDDVELVRYLRLRTYWLERRRESQEMVETSRKDPAVIGVDDDVLPPVDPEVLNAEMDAIPQGQRLVAMGDFEVVVASADQIPSVVTEIGRLREVTFRAVGEGTGNESDLDEFDPHYLHLVLWDRKLGRVAGAYRMGCTDRIQREQDRDGLYSTTLFDLSHAFFARVGPAIELGRSFVTQEYQRKPASLALLWKGIGTFVCRNPHYRCLIGPVSISSRYSPISKSLMVAWIKRHAAASELTHLVAPKNPTGYDRGRRKRLLRATVHTATELQDVSQVISDIEYEHRGVPVLLKEYVKLGGRFAAFSVDHEFSDVIDGLVVVDLFQAPKRSLERYMGKEGAQKFLAHHSAPLATLSEPETTP